MKRLVFVLALGLILTVALYGEGYSRITPYDYVDPSKVGPNDDHPWGGDEDDGDNSNDPNNPKNYSRDLATGFAPRGNSGPHAAPGGNDRARFQP